MTKISSKAILLSLMMVFTLQITAQNRYSATLDLTKVEDDQLKVVVKTPDVEGRKLLYVFPKVVPGTYDSYDFGRFVSNFKAYTENGKKVKVRKNDVNSYWIKKAFKVDRVEYSVDDTWDDYDGSKYVFQPGGTSIDEGKQFVLNTFSLLGYFRDYPKLPYEVKIDKPNNFYGATSLKRVSSTPSRDMFKADNYVELVDQPIMYAIPDTISYMEGGAKVGIAVYSPDNSINAKLIKEVLQPLTQATSFVLGNIPTDEYWFIFHFFDFSDPVFRKGGGAYGALEHNKSSFYYLPLIPDGDDGVDVESILETISSIGAHEFLHVLAPLNLHSEEIAYFDFYETEMSEHLWLYEGVTEYLSHKCRVIGELISMEEFLDETEGKIRAASNYKDISFTKMSKNILDEEMNKEYGNVYQKGSLIAMLLDIEIAEATNGKKDLIDIVLELIEDYGMEQPFKDEELFDAITAKTGPSVGAFFKDYVIGAKPLPYAEEFSKCGLKYELTNGGSKLTFGGVKMKFDSERGLLMIEPDEDNMVIKEPLAIAKLNGEDLSFKMVRKVLLNPETDAPLVISHIKDGETKELVLKPIAAAGDLEHTIVPMEEMTESQQMLYKRLFTKGNR